jgi:hypothetical protein
MEFIKKSLGKAIIQDSPWFAKAVSLLFIFSGFVLWASGAFYYGIGAWDRIPYEAGIGLALLGFATFLFLGYQSRCELDPESKTFHLTHKKGMRTLKDVWYPFAEVTDVRLEKKKEDNSLPVYRLSIYTQREGWIPVSPRFTANRVMLERIGAQITTYLNQPILTTHA